MKTREELLNDAASMEADKRTAFQFSLVKMSEVLCTLFQILGSEEYEKHFPDITDEKKFLQGYMELIRKHLADVEKRSELFYVSRGLLRIVEKGGEA